MECLPWWLLPIKDLLDGTESTDAFLVTLQKLRKNIWTSINEKAMAFGHRFFYIGSNCLLSFLSSSLQHLKFQWDYLRYQQPHPHAISRARSDICWSRGGLSTVTTSSKLWMSQSNEHTPRCSNSSAFASSCSGIVKNTIGHPIVTALIQVNARFVTRKTMISELQKYWCITIYGVSSSS